METFPFSQTFHRIFPGSSVRDMRVNTIQNYYISIHNDRFSVIRKTYDRNMSPKIYRMNNFKNYNVLFGNPVYIVFQKF